MVLTELRIVLRGLRRRPGYTLAAVATLAIGIGANTTVFTIVNGVLLRPLAFDDPERLVTLWSVSPPPQRIPNFPMSYPDFLDWREQLASVEGMAFTYAASRTLRTADGPAPVIAAAVTDGFLDLLGVRPARGTLLPPGSDRAIVLKHRTWETHFASDPGIVGRVISLDDGPYTVVGVLDPAVRYPIWADVFLPLRPEVIAQWGLNERGFRIDTRAVARLPAADDLERVRSELAAIADRLGEAHPETNVGWQAQVMPMDDIQVERLRAPLYALLGAVGFVLLIACANVANLSLASVLDRRRDLAVRSALGEPTGWVVRRALLESAALALAGGAAGFVAARWSLDLFLARMGRLLPGPESIGIDYAVFLFAAAAITGSAVLSSVAPQMFTLRHRRGDALRMSSGIRGFVGGNRVQGGLAAVQVGLTLVLLIGAGLLLRSFVNLQNVETGFDPTRLMGMRIDPPMPRYEDAEARAGLFNALERETAAAAEMENAALITHMPLVGGIVGTPVRSGSMDQPVPARFNQASPGFFDAAAIPVIRGRSFSTSEMRPGTRSVVISDNLADALFPGRDPIGASLRYDVINGMSPHFGETLDGTVVGVVGNVRYRLDDAQPALTLYVPATADPWPATYLLARARPGAADPLGALRDAVRRVDPDIPVTGLDTIERVVGRSLENRRAGVVLTGVFAVLATALAAVGLFGVLSYLVRQRVGEIGLRMALGAGSRDIARWVLARAAAMFAGGLGIGLLGVAVTTRLVRGMLFGVGPLSPTTVSAVTALLAAVMAAAAYLPARRASRVDPMEALRTE